MGQRHTEGHAWNIHDGHGESFFPPCSLARIERRVKHDELHDLLYDAAVSHGVQIQHHAKVVDIDVENREVILENGERIGGDVLVGADGEFGQSRTVVLGRPIHGRPTGTALYWCVETLLFYRSVNRLY